MGHQANPAHCHKFHIIQYRQICSTQHLTILFWDWGRQQIAVIDSRQYTSDLSFVNWVLCYCCQCRIQNMSAFDLTTRYQRTKNFPRKNTLDFKINESTTVLQAVNEMIFIYTVQHFDLIGKRFVKKIMAHVCSTCVTKSIKGFQIQANIF